MQADTVVMTEIRISNVEQILRRVVKDDGRCGGLQFHAGKIVDIIIYKEEHEEN